MDLIGVLYHARMVEGTIDIYPDEYEIERSKYCELYEEILNLLPEDKKHLLIDLDITGAAMMGICEETGYKMGFCDANKLSNEVLPKTA